MSPFRSWGKVNTRWKYGTGSTSRRPAATEGGGAAGENGAPYLGLGSRQGMGGQIGRAVTAQHLGQTHPGNGANHAGALNAWAGPAVPEARWCPSDGCA